MIFFPFLGRSLAALALAVALIASPIAPTTPTFAADPVGAPAATLASAPSVSAAGTGAVFDAGCRTLNACAPWRAGMGVGIPSAATYGLDWQKYCTVGFAVRALSPSASRPTQHLLIAKHCVTDGTAITDVYGPAFNALSCTVGGPLRPAYCRGGDLLGNVDQPGSDQLDAALFAVNAAWVGPLNRVVIGTRNAAYSGTAGAPASGTFPVLGSQDPKLGTWVCKSGSSTGETCGTTFVLNDGRHAIHALTQPGDSGGPVYEYVPGGVLAVGMVSKAGADAQPNQPYLVYTPIGDILSQLHATLCIDATCGGLPTAGSSPAAGFSLSSSNLSRPGLVRATDRSRGGGRVVYSWGDGTAPTLSPTHVYQGGGVFRVWQTVYGPNGSVGVAQQAITVHPVASFTDTVQPGTWGMVHVFKTIAYPGYSFSWDFGDSTSHETGAGSIMHTFARRALFLVTLRLTRLSDGAWGEQQVVVTVEP